MGFEPPKDLFARQYRTQRQGVYALLASSGIEAASFKRDEVR